MLPKPSCCRSAATNKMCRHASGVGVSAAAAQPRCPAPPLPHGRVMGCVWSRLTATNERTGQRSPPWRQNDISMSTPSPLGGSRSVDRHARFNKLKCSPSIGVSKCGFASCDTDGVVATPRRRGDTAERLATPRRTTPVGVLATRRPGDAPVSWRHDVATTPGASW